MSKSRYDDFLLAFGKANTYVFQTSAAMQKAAASMWKDIKNKPDELNTFLKEVKDKNCEIFTLNFFSIDSLW